MMSVLFNPMVESGIAPDTAWRLAMIVPAVMFLIVAISLKLLCWDTPTARPVFFLVNHVVKVEGIFFAQAF